jgi:hypothetical protein
MVDIIAEAALANIQINHPDALAGIQKRGNKVHGNRGFSGPALLITNNNNERAHVRRGLISLGSYILAGLVQNFSFIFVRFDYKPDS